MKFEVLTLQVKQPFGKIERGVATTVSSEVSGWETKDCKFAIDVHFYSFVKNLN